MASGGILEWLRTRRRALEDDLVGRGRAHMLSMTRYRLHNALATAISQCASGDCLDAGAGRSPYKQLLLQHASTVTSVDVEDRAGQTDLIADIQSMPQLADAAFDTILCSQVLEHVPRPWDAMRELARVLRPGGALILTVPHLSPLHELPHDYYRYTEYGLRWLCDQCGLQVVQIQSTGGLGCFLTHGISSVLLSTLGVMPLLGTGVFWLNYIFLVRLPNLVEPYIGMMNLYPSEYLLVARKTAAQSANTP
jgi:SAM-dependent methyltransferase